MTPSTPYERPTGVVTNGEGKVTTAHLNLTKPMGEAPATQPEQPAQKPKAQVPAKPRRRDRRREWKVHMRRGARVPFAGFDPTEKQLGVHGGSWA